MREARNEIFQTKSQRFEHVGTFSDIEPAAGYRSNLEPLLRTCVTIETEKWKYEPWTVDGRPCVRILLRNAKVIKFPTKKKSEVHEPVIIEHIWTVMDKDWLNRVEPQEDKPLLVKGFFYEYASRGKKNIGLQALAAYNTPGGRKKKDATDQLR